MKTTRYIIILVACIAYTAQAWAQKTVAGRVTDQNNRPIAGVTVVVKGTVVATTTNQEGRYSIDIPRNASDVLLFTSGYETIERQAPGTTLDVKIEDVNKTIDEVVVVGYGTVRKSDLTGSVASVKIDEIEATQVASFDKLLQGKAAGVQVVTGSSAPGGAVSVTIRGTSSFNGTGEPLYVVDGIILNPSTQDVANPISSTGQEKQNALTSINPQDIASIEILKDASATAIYGSMGANGVILITTKSGASDTPRIEWTSSVEIAKIRKKIPVLDLDGFILYSDAVGAQQLSADTLDAINWQDYTMRTAVSQSHRLSVSGKGRTNNYYIAAGYLNNQGILKKTNVTQSSFRINYDQNLGQYVKVGTKITLTNNVNNMTQGTEPGGTQNATRATNMMRQMLGSKPYRINDLAIISDDEKLHGTDIWLNNYDDISKEYRINAMAYGDVTIFKWLRFRSTFGTDYRNKNRTRWYGEYIDNARNGRGGVSELNSFRYNLDNLLTVSTKFGQHRIDATLGQSVSYNINKNSTVDAMDFPDHEFRAKGISTARTQTPNYLEDEAALVSFFARILYNYKERYVLTSTFRADGSSKFSKNNRFSYFPSFAFAWRVSEEAFMKNISAVSSLKLRLGWGMVGNQGISPYQTLTTYNKIPMANPLTDYNAHYNGTFLMGIKPSHLTNSDLKWETTEQYNAGIDIGILKNRINLTVDVYQKYTKDLLQYISAPLSSGFTNEWMNRGKIENKGLEISADVAIIRGNDLNWTVSGNISFNRNKISDTGLPEAWFGTIHSSGFWGGDIGNDATYFKMPANIYLQGRPVALLYGWKTDGLVQQSDVDAGDLPTYQGKTLVPGDIKYIDIDKSGNIDDNDKTLIGNPNPKFIYGFSTGVSYKNLSLSVNFNGSYGNKVVNGNLLQEDDTAPSNPSGNINNIRSASFYNAWTPDNTGAYYPRLRKTNNSGDFTDRIVEDGSYLRMASATLSYMFNFKKSKMIKNLGISFTARNPFLWTRYSGWDPDVSSFSSGSQKAGVDWGSYPSTRAYVFGLSATF